VKRVVLVYLPPPIGSDPLYLNRELEIGEIGEIETKQSILYTRYE
jgi:hypothetical protein